jgi:hypothetical protein
MLNGCSNDEHMDSEEEEENDNDDEADGDESDDDYSVYESYMGEEEDEWEDTQAVDIEESSLMDLIGII